MITPEYIKETFEQIKIEQQKIRETLEKLVELAKESKDKKKKSSVKPSTEDAQQE